MFDFASKSLKKQSQIQINVKWNTRSWSQTIDRIGKKSKLFILFNWFYGLRSFEKLCIFNTFIHGWSEYKGFNLLSMCFFFVFLLLSRFFLVAWTRARALTRKIDIHYYYYDDVGSLAHKRETHTQKQTGIVKLIIFWFEYLLFLHAFHWIRAQRRRRRWRCPANSKIRKFMIILAFLSVDSLIHSSKMLKNYDLFILIKRIAFRWAPKPVWAESYRLRADGHPNEPKQIL